MQYEGVEFEVRNGLGQHRWVWTVHTPSPKRGVVLGKRERAIRAAERAITQWRNLHPLIIPRAPEQVAASAP